MMQSPFAVSCRLAAMLCIACTARPTEPSNPTGVFSVRDDFSHSANPSGAWAYGFAKALASPVELYTSTANAYDPRISQWTSDIGIDPNVATNLTAGDVTVPQGFTIPHSRYVYLHPGPNGELSVVRWTAPRPGRVRVNATFTAPPGQCPTTSDVHVLKNAEVLFSALVERTDGNTDIEPRSFESSFTVASDDVLAFAVGFGSNQSYTCDRTLLSATITYKD